MLAVALGISLFAASMAASCTDRGGCTCDCNWATSWTCGMDDGTCCFACCCKTVTSSSPQPPPSPGPPSPPQPPGPKALYCPAAQDLGGSGVRDQGWTIRGPGGAYTRAAFNLLGGYVEFDLDVTGAQVGINNNLYTISPDLKGGAYNHQTHYCDAQAPQGKYCMELDVIESNGNCGGQTTLHTRYGKDGGCDSNGCHQNYRFAQTQIHIKAELAETGEFSAQVGSTIVRQSSMSPLPSAASTAIVASTMAQLGAVIVSTQWQGWVPRPDCGGGGVLSSSQFSVSNLRIYGSVVQGPQPRQCPTTTLATTTTITTTTTTTITTIRTSTATLPSSTSTVAPNTTTILANTTVAITTSITAKELISRTCLSSFHFWPFTLLSSLLLSFYGL